MLLLLLFRAAAAAADDDDDDEGDAFCCSDGIPSRIRGMAVSVNTILCSVIFSPKCLWCKLIYKQVTAYLHVFVTLQCVALHGEIAGI